MKDRISTYPNRIGLTDSYGVKKLYTLSREDEPLEEGTKLNKANLLSDDTSTLLKLTDNPTVNDAIGKIGEYLFGYSWNKYEFVFSLGAETVHPIENTNDKNAKYLNWYNGDRYWYYADSISVTKNGVILDNPSRINAVGNGSQLQSLFRGKYISEANDGSQVVMRVASDAVIVESSAQVIYFTDRNKIFDQNIISAKTYITKVYDLDSNAYPEENYAEDGYYYGEKLIISEKSFEFGSYYGNGLSGATNANILTFDFVPKFVIIHRANGADNALLVNGCTGNHVFYGGGTITGITVEWNDNSVSWYTSNVQQQLNLSGTEYKYIAFK